jgi:hypothetical protein
MASKAIQRALLVVALIATAHLLKPFSARSVATHLLQSANSFSFILPQSAAGSLEQANYLAAMLDNGLRMMEERKGSNWTPEGLGWTNGTAFASDLPPFEERSDNVKSVKAASPCRDSAKAVTQTLAKAKPRPVKNLFLARAAKLAEKALAAEQALAISLPALEIEKIITVELPTLKAQLPLTPSAAPLPRMTAASFALPSPKASCPTERMKPPQPISQEEAKLHKLEANLEQLLANATAIKLLCAKERERIRTCKLITQTGVKSS